ncbi:hypothetical protein V6N13_134685 [Hibiscus sabdariffa]|uniref:Uncharacterized protein n=1 Tax=Hibiscus sabdariffa TaxID=183260 RepID=A0ABR2R4H2_9ROSI
MLLGEVFTTPHTRSPGIMSSHVGLRAVLHAAISTTSVMLLVFLCHGVRANSQHPLGLATSASPYTPVSLACTPRPREVITEFFSVGYNRVSELKQVKVVAQT